MSVFAGPPSTRRHTGWPAEQPVVGAGIGPHPIDSALLLTPPPGDGRQRTSRRTIARRRHGTPRHRPQSHLGLVRRVDQPLLPGPAGEAGQVRGGVVQAGDGLVELAARPGRVSGARQHQGGVLGDVAEPGFFQWPPQPSSGRFRGGELSGSGRHPGVGLRRGLVQDPERYVT